MLVVEAGDEKDQEPHEKEERKWNEVILQELRRWQLHIAHKKRRIESDGEEKKIAQEKEGELPFADPTHRKNYTRTEAVAPCYARCVERRKKVLFLITKSEPFGGAQRYVYDLATHVPSEQFDIAVAAGGKGLLLEKLQAAGVRTIPIPSLQRDISMFAEVRAFFEVFAIIRREKPDVLHLNSSKAGALGALAGRLCGVRRIIFTAHGWAFEENRTFLSRILIKVASWVTILLCHNTIAISETMRRAMHALPGTRGIRVIHNGLSPVVTLPCEEARAFLAQKGIAADGPIIGAIAELHHIKGLEYAIQALGTSSISASFVVFGEGDEREKLEALVREYGLQEKVFFLGFVPDAAKYLSAFDIFTLPSLYEGLGFAVLEAGSAGLPVVATRVGGIPEIIEDSESGILVSPRNATELAQAFETLIENTALRERYGTALQERVHTHFSLERMLEETVALY